jgi:hypothetical protein
MPAIRAVEVPEIVIEILKSMTRREFHYALTKAHAAGRAVFPPDAISDVGRGLLEAQLWWVSAAMTDLCIAASASLPAATLTVDLPPRPAGSWCSPTKP